MEIIWKERVLQVLFMCSVIFYLFFISEYHFNVWLIIANEKLTLDLLNSTSQQYKTLEANVIYEVDKLKYNSESAYAHLETSEES